MKNLAFLILFVFTLSCSKDENSSSDEPVTGTVTDIEGNVYRTAKIGSQVWMLDYLRATKWRNGKVIPKDLYYAYDNNSSNVNKYGYLYYYKIMVDTNSLICPAGFRIPTVNDFKELANIFNNDSIAAQLHKYDIRVTGGMVFNLTEGVLTPYWFGKDTGQYNFWAFNKNELNVLIYNEVYVISKRNSPKLDEFNFSYSAHRLHPILCIKE